MSHLYILVLLACLSIGTTTWSVSLPERNRVIGLKSTAHISKFPYEVSLRRKFCMDCAYEHYCGGAIYSKNTILTSASCVEAVEEQLIHLQVVAGTSYREGAAHDGSIFHVASITRHDNVDIAILHLTTDIPLNGFTMKALPIAEEMPRSGKMAIVAGWGQENELDATNSEELREIRLPIMEQDECKRVYSWHAIQDHEFCAGYAAGGVDACQGDAGSPLLMDNHMVGLVSWGFGCARSRSPGVYTNVVQLREWIESQVRSS